MNMALNKICSDGLVSYTMFGSKTVLITLICLFNLRIKDYALFGPMLSSPLAGDLITDRV